MVSLEQLGGFLKAVVGSFEREAWKTEKQKDASSKYSKGERSAVTPGERYGSPSGR